MTQISNMQVIGYMVHCLKIVKLWHFSIEFSFELQMLLSTQPFCGLYQGSWHVLHYTVHVTPLLLEALWKTTSSVCYRWTCVSHHTLLRTRLSAIPIWQHFSCSPYKMQGKWLTMRTCHCWVNLAIFLVISVACLLCAWLTICLRDASNLDQNVVERLSLFKLRSSYRKPINLVQLGVSLIPHICPGVIPWLHDYSRNARNVAKTAQCSDAHICSCGLQHMDTWCWFLLASWQNWICIQCSFCNRPSIPKLVTVEIWG